MKSQIDISCFSFQPIFSVSAGRHVEERSWNVDWNVKRLCRISTNRSSWKTRGWVRWGEPASRLGVPTLSRARRADFNLYTLELCVGLPLKTVPCSRPLPSSHFPSTPYPGTYLICPWVSTQQCSHNYISLHIYPIVHLANWVWG